MMEEKQLDDEALDNIAGGKINRLKGRKTASFVKMACGKCGAILSVDINHANAAMCPGCGHKNILAG